MSFFASQNTAIDSNESQNQTSGIEVANASSEAPRLIASFDGKILHSNDGFSELSEGNILEGRHLNDLFFFNNHEGEINDGEYLVTMRDTNKEVLLQFSWITDKNQQTYLIASAEDLKAGDKLLHYVADQVENKNNETDHTPFLELSFDACSITDLEGNFETINENFSQILGYSIEDLSSKSLADLMHPEYRMAHVTGIQSLKSNDDIENSYISLDAYCIDSNNKAKWIEWNHKKVGDRIYSTGRDLTPLKSYKNSLKRQEKKLKEAEAIGHIGQWEWKIGSEEISFSDQLYKIFGIEKRSFKPTLERITSMIHRDDAGRMEQVFQRAIIEQNDYDMDFRITRNEGETRFIRCEGRCEVDNEDDVIALYGIMQDVTDTMKKEHDLRHAKESVERAYAAKTQFLANMSHELRTPLNAIIGFSEMMERQLLGPIGTEKYLEYISGIRESGVHLLDLISDILDMSKIEAGKYELSLEEFNVCKVIRMAVHMIEGRAVQNAIKINITAQNEERKIIADRRAVMQMALNLLSNAVKFSHQNGQINIDISEKMGSVYLKITDKGIGIPANKLANITMPFEQAETDYTREYEGTGLGLSITKELAEIHGGSLNIESVLDEGTVVTIKLPFQTVSTENEKTED